MKKSIKHILVAMTAMTMLAATSACKSDDETTSRPEPELMSVEKELALTANATDGVLNVKADCHWEVLVDKSAWPQLTVTPLEGDGNGTVVIQTDPNTSSRERLATITFVTKGGLKQVVTVRHTLSGAAISVNATEISFEAVPTGSFTLTLACNTNWRVLGLESAPWVHLDKTAGTEGVTDIVVTADEVPDDAQRTALITFTDGTNTRDVTVIQEGKTNIMLSVSTNRLEPFEGKGSEQTFTVQSNAQWNVIIPESARSWMRAEPMTGMGNGEVRVWCEPNPSLERNRMTILFVTAGKLEPQLCDIAVEQLPGNEDDDRPEPVGREPLDEDNPSPTPARRK